jgi:hypothetical protein
VARPSEGERLKSVVLAEEQYQLLLELLTTDRRCERFIYAARPTPVGVELSGEEEDFEELVGVVACAADNASTKRYQRRWDDVHASLEPKARDWLEHSTDVVLDELAGFGLVASRPHVAQLLHRRLAELASGLGISEGAARRYVGDESFRQLARQAAVELAGEQPGADLLDQPRTVPVALQTLGRVVAALAESAHVRVANADPVGAHGALQLLSLFGQIVYELPAPSTGPVLLPQAALVRGARLLDATAEMLLEGAAVTPDLPAESAPMLASAFALDAGVLRALVSEHGTSAGPTPLS